MNQHECYGIKFKRDKKYKKGEDKIKKKQKKQKANKNIKNKNKTKKGTNPFFC